ncbi:MAG: hypothetical protein HY001_01750, partial [Candidatus Portnoybacteria bacterium]|nr:hypothetical protein [Candidatus Portnoybacteria bacterium]
MQKFLPTLLIGFLVFVPLLSGAADDPLVVRTPGIALQIPSVAFDLRPVVNVLTAPFRFLAFVKEKIDAVPKQIAGFFTAPSRIEKLEKEVEAKLGAYRREADANPIEVGLRYIQPEPSRTIIREKEIIREIIVKDNGATTIVKESAIPPAPSDEKLSALKTELTDSFASRINKLTGGFGFNTNRFDDLFVQKSLELAGKLNQPPAVASSPITFSSSITSKDISATSLALSSTLTVSGTATSTIRGPLVAGSGNVQIIDSSGRIPALSSTYFASLPGIFASIGNASSTVQFSASSTSDVLSFEGTGGITISFDSINKKIVFASTNPTLLSVLQQGADASTFTGTTKIAGLT